MGHNIENRVGHRIKNQDGPHHEKLGWAWFQKSGIFLKIEPILKLKMVEIRFCRLSGFDLAFIQIFAVGLKRQNIVIMARTWLSSLSDIMIVAESKVCVICGAHSTFSRFSRALLCLKVYWMCISNSFTLRKIPLILQLKWLTHWALNCTFFN